MHDWLLTDQTVSWPSMVTLATYSPHGDALTMDTSWPTQNHTQHIIEFSLHSKPLTEQKLAIFKIFEKKNSQRIGKNM